MAKGRKLSRSDQSCSETEGDLGVRDPGLYGGCTKMESSELVMFERMGLEWAGGLKFFMERLVRSCRERQGFGSVGSDSLRVRFPSSWGTVSFGPSRTSEEQHE